MSVRQSTGLRNAMCGYIGFAGAFKNGEIRIYSGTQPASADASATGTLLGVVTIGASARVPELLPVATITLAGTAGAVEAVKIAGLDIIPKRVIYDTSISDLATALAASINAVGVCSAVASGAVVTVAARAGTGALWSGAVLSATATSLTATVSGTMAGGQSADNGLVMSMPVGGVVSKPAGDYWRFDGLTDGTAGWFRFVGNPDDTGGSSTVLARLDGSIGATGDMVLASTAITSGAPNTIDSFTYTIPAF